MDLKVARVLRMADIAVPIALQRSLSLKAARVLRMADIDVPNALQYEMRSWNLKAARVLRMTDIGVPNALRGELLERKSCESTTDGGHRRAERPTK